MDMVSQSFFAVLLSFITNACQVNTDVATASNGQNVEVTEEKVQPQNTIHGHQLWDELTQEHVTDKGFVNYKGFLKDSTKLKRYLQQLSKNHPNKNWSSNERKAFWINAYNAYTIELIVDNYPVKSIKDLGGSIYRVNTPWDIKFIEIGDEEYDLNDIEHNILRKEWEDPRIHAAVNCASVSCPALMQGAYIGKKLDAQLDAQMKRFILDSSKNTISEKALKLSKLFKWFSGDFKNVAPSVIDYINRFTDLEISEDAQVEYKEYGWGLNDT